MLCQPCRQPHDAVWCASHRHPGADALALAQRELSQWQGYAPTPLHSLPALARALGVASVHYKDEGGRFGLGSFKALGGAYAVARLLCRELGRKLGRALAPRICCARKCVRCARTSP
jgi:threonine dehydratase